MTGVPSTAEHVARPGRGTEAAPQCRSLHGWPKATPASAAPEPALIVARAQEGAQVPGRRDDRQPKLLDLDRRDCPLFGVRAQPRL